MNYQEFSSDENFVSSEDTIFIFPCEDITVVMATWVSANEIYKCYMPYCYNIQDAYKGYLFSLFFNQNLNVCKINIFY